MDVTNAQGLLVLRDVSKFHNGENGRRIHAIDTISLSVRKGEFISIIGPSGCGKSTILRLIAGLDLPTSGSITYGQQPVNGPNPKRGLVFQNYNAFPWLSVRDNVAFGVRDRNVSISSKIDSWLKNMGLAEYGDLLPKQLSGGMRQRLALARTMIAEPELLLLDEPFGALDERIRANMQQLLLEIVDKTRCTVVLVTHDIREAILLANRIIVLQSRPGRICREFECALPAPRSRQLFKTDEFNQLYESVIESFPI